METATLSTNFLGLPRELRDQIYEMVVLKRSNTITMLNSASSDVSARRPDLACVNRQIRSEVLPLFYGRNVFLAELTDDEELDCALRWLACIGADNIRHLKHLSLCGWTKAIIEWSGGREIIPRWVKITLDLQEGNFELAPRQEPQYGSLDIGSHPRVQETVVELKAAFEELVAARTGQGIDIGVVRDLMSGFHALCTETT